MISSWVESGANPLLHVFIEVLGIFFGIARRSAARCSALDPVAPHEALSRAMVPTGSPVRVSTRTQPVSSAGCALRGTADEKSELGA